MQGILNFMMDFEAPHVLVIRTTFDLSLCQEIGQLLAIITWTTTS